jgi:hypothetical protein
VQAEGLSLFAGALCVLGVLACSGVQASDASVPFSGPTLPFSTIELTECDPRRNIFYELAFDPVSEPFEDTLLRWHLWEVSNSFG